MTTSTTNVSERLQRGSWRDYRNVVAGLSPQLAAIIDGINPPDNAYLYMATYRYGEPVVSHGKFCLPSDTVLDAQSGASNNLYEDLYYSTSLPLALMIDKVSEVFDDQPDGVVSLNVFSPGDMAGAYEALSIVTGSVDMQPNWSISAGVNTVCLLGKASNAVKHRQLQLDCDLHLPAPKTLAEQRYIFNQIGQKSDWECKILFFSRSWVSYTKDKNWMPLYYYLFKIAWHQMRNIRNERHFDAYWDGDRFVKHVNAAARRIMMIISKYSPGLTVVNDQEWLLPAKRIEQAYTEEYCLDYAPILMGPAFLGRAEYESDTVYLSGAYGGIAVGDDQGYSKGATIGFKELERIGVLLSGMGCFSRDIAGDGLLCRGVRLGGEEVRARFFYGGTAATSSSLFLDGNDFCKYDSRARALLEGRFAGRNLPALAVFLRSCVQLSLVPDATIGY